MNTFRDKLMGDIAAKKQAIVDTRRAAQETMQTQADERRARVAKAANLMEDVLQQAVDALNTSNVAATLKPLTTHRDGGGDDVTGHVLTVKSHGRSERIVLNYVLGSVETKSHKGPLEVDKFNTVRDAENFVSQQLEKLGLV